MLSFKFGRADVPQVGMAPFSVVELLQVGKNMLPGNIPGWVRRPIALFPLEAGERRLHDRVIPAIPLVTHAARHQHALQGMLVDLTCILTVPKRWS